MTISKGLYGLVVCAAFAALAFSPAPAKAATSNTSFGTCSGSDTSGGGGSDCVAALGHISASVVGTLTINEQRAVSFGNFAVNCGGDCGGDGTIVLDVNGNRHTPNAGNDQIVLLNGIDNGGFGGPNQDTGSQSPGHYTVETGIEGAATQVYISFADNTNGNIIDICEPNGGTGGAYGGGYSGLPGTCDIYHPGNKITLTGPTGQHFFVDQFTFNESGSDVFGHYIDNSGAAVGPGSPTPFDHNHTASGANTPGTVDVVVGGTLHTDDLAGAATYAQGKYTGTFDIMVSY